MKIARSIATLLACVTTTTMILAATLLSARADDPLDDHQFLPLINTGSAKCFEPTGGSGNGRLIQQRTCSPGVIRPGTNDRPIQFYHFQMQGYMAYNDQGWFGPICSVLGCIPDGTRSYFIRNLETNLCLDVKDGLKNDSAVVQQWECTKNARSMLWHVQPGDFPGMFKVRNFNSDRCLDVRGGSSADGAQLQQYHCTSLNLAQNFGQKFPAEWPVADLNGRWTAGGPKSPVIHAGLGSIVIDMSAFNRPAARGTFFGGCLISVNFPDDATFQGVVSACSNPNPLTITWSNHSVWTKQP